MVPFDFNRSRCVILTAGPTYLDIDAYACIVAMAELLRLRGVNAVAYSAAPCNYSVCDFLKKEGQILRELPEDISAEESDYIIVDVSDPDFLKFSVPLERVVQIYDHHTGAEKYWSERIGENSHIEFIGAAATMIYREWKKSGLQSEMSRSVALLLIAAILDNTLNLTSSNTTKEDIEAFNDLCAREGIDDKWCAGYFSSVQTEVENDLKNALFGDLKMLGSEALPKRVAQLCVWDGERLLERIEDIRSWFRESPDSWMINIIDIRNRCSYFVCDDGEYQNNLSGAFDVFFESGVARTSKAWLRKEIIKKTSSIRPTEVK